MASAGGDWKDMYYAAERGDVACVRFHLSEGVDVNYQHPEAMMSALVNSSAGLSSARTSWFGLSVTVSLSSTDSPHR